MKKIILIVALLYPNIIYADENCKGVAALKPSCLTAEKVKGKIDNLEQKKKNLDKKNPTLFDAWKNLKSN